MPKDMYIDKDDTQYSYERLEREDAYFHVRNFTDSRNESGDEEMQEKELPRRTLRRRGDAKPPRKPNVPVGMVRCPVCEALVPKSRIEEHVEKYHTEQSNDEIPLERCPVCNAKVRADRLEKHVRKVHSEN